MFFSVTVPILLVPRCSFRFVLCFIVAMEFLFLDSFERDTEKRRVNLVDSTEQWVQIIGIIRFEMNDYVP